ncbi:MAG: hypothetical protein V8S98_13460 [Lachnospiraceae bacterium]
MRLGKKADLVLCLYDVIGSFVNEKDYVILMLIFESDVHKNGCLGLSVMTLELTQHIAQNIVPVVMEVIQGDW